MMAVANMPEQREFILMNCSSVREIKCVCFPRTFDLKSESQNCVQECLWGMIWV